MSTVKEYMLHGISYRFAVRERTDTDLSEVGKARKFSAVRIGVEEGYGEDTHTFSWHPTFEEANEAAIAAENEFLDEHREDLGS
tara:strand:- start:1045 stop:1296 length:252 start_codon:yes stop_codon:yes gene_type:complete